MAQQAQQMSAGRLTICLSLCYGVTFHSCVCVARLAAVKSLLAVLGFTWLSPQCALIVSRFCCTFSPFEFVFYFYIFIYIYILLPFTSGKKSASPLHADLASWQSLTTLQIRMVLEHWSINSADSSNERTSSGKQKSLACGISMRRVIKWRLNDKAVSVSLLWTLQTTW